MIFWYISKGSRNHRLTRCALLRHQSIGRHGYKRWVVKTLLWIILTHKLLQIFLIVSTPGFINYCSKQSLLCRSFSNPGGPRQRVVIQKQYCESTQLLAKNFCWYSFTNTVLKFWSYFTLKKKLCSRCHRMEVAYLFHGRLKRSEGPFLLPLQATKLSGSDIDFEGIKQTFCFIIQDHPTVPWAPTGAGAVNMALNSPCKGGEWQV